LDLKKKEAILERPEALNVGHDLSNANNKLNKLQADVRKCWKDYDDFACQVCNSKLELTRVKKELTLTKKNIVKQHELTFAHTKERMKDKELEKEQIKFEKTKENNLSNFLSHGVQPCQHACLDQTLLETRFTGPESQLTYFAHKADGACTFTYYMVVFYLIAGFMANLYLLWNIHLPIPTVPLDCPMLPRTLHQQLLYDCSQNHCLACLFCCSDCHNCFEVHELI
jgi:hypothetical protein